MSEKQDKTIESFSEEAIEIYVKNKKNNSLDWLNTIANKFKDLPYTEQSPKNLEVFKNKLKEEKNVDNVIIAIIMGMDNKILCMEHIKLIDDMRKKVEVMKNRALPSKWNADKAKELEEKRIETLEFNENNSFDNGKRVSNFFKKVAVCVGLVTSGLGAILLGIGIAALFTPIGAFVALGASIGAIVSGGVSTVLGIVASVRGFKDLKVSKVKEKEDEEVLIDSKAEYLSCKERVFNAQDKDLTVPLLQKNDMENEI